VAIAVGDEHSAEAYDLRLATSSGRFRLHANETKDVWKVNTTLVQRTNDELFSLVAPK